MIWINWVVIKLNKYDSHIVGNHRICGFSLGVCYFIHSRKFEWFEWIVTSMIILDPWIWINYEILNEICVSKFVNIENAERNKTYNSITFYWVVQRGLQASAEEKKKEALYNDVLNSKLCFHCFRAWFAHVHFSFICTIHIHFSALESQWGGGWVVYGWVGFKFGVHARTRRKVSLLVSCP